jgi:glycosyltransferase involved in cell wall biosynthesis
LGGAQKVCLSLFKGLQQKGGSPHLISGTEGPLVSAITHETQVYLLKSMQREVSVAALFAELQTFWRLISLLRRLRRSHPHLIVHTHSTKAGIMGRWAAFFAGITTRIHTIHGYGFHEYRSWIAWLFIYWLEVITAAITTHFICVSAADAKIGSRLLPRFSAHHSIIRAAVDNTAFYYPATRIVSATTPFIFGTIACFKPQKNIQDLLAAFAMVHSHLPQARLEIIGDGIQRPLIEQWIARHQLQQVIILHGWQQNVAPLMERWHAFVLSSLWEGLPCAIIEARLMHLPVISYRVGGIPEVITHEENGLLCAARDVPALAHNMRRVIQEQSLYQKLEHHTDILEDFHITAMVAEHMALYKKLRHPFVSPSS